MKKIMVTGATGFLGLAILSKFEETNYSVIRVFREPNMSIAKDTDIIVDNIDSRTNWKDKLTQTDIIIHCAARVHVMSDSSAEALEKYRNVNTHGTINLAKHAVASGVKRFIFISSIKVNGESTQLGRAFGSSDARSPADFYGQSKSEAEVQLLQLAKDTGLEVVIIRPTLVYGSGVKANFASLLNLVSKGLPLPFGCINDNKRSLVSVTNLVDLIFTCIEHPKATNQVFLVSDDHDVSTASMVKYMSQALGKSCRLLPVPLWFYRFFGKLLGKTDVVDRLTGSLQVDIQHTKDTLGWAPPQTLEQGFKETAEAFLLNKNK